MSKSQNHEVLDMKTLIKYARGDEDIIRKWSKYIKRNPDMAAKAQTLEKLVGLFDSIDDACNTPAAVRLASRIFDAFKKAKKGTSRNDALLFYDSGIVPLPEGVRPSLVSERRLKYSTACGNLELSILPVFPGRHEITGRFDADGAGVAGTISLTGKSKMQADIDDLGFFVFSDILPGSYRIDFICNGEKSCVRDLKIK